MKKIFVYIAVLLTVCIWGCRKQEKTIEKKENNGDIEKKEESEMHNIVKECNCMVFVNGQELGGKYYSYIDYQEKYAKIPLIQILETLGASVTWENKNNAVILFGNKKYLLDMMENSIIESGMKNNLIAPPPGISHPCCFEVGEKEFVIDTDSVRRFLKLLNVTISIDYESSKIYISTIDNSIYQNK